jgi:hypothetical protein
MMDTEPSFWLAKDDVEFIRFQPKGQVVDVLGVYPSRRLLSISLVKERARTLYSQALRAGYHVSKAPTEAFFNWTLAFCK